MENNSFDYQDQSIGMALSEFIAICVLIDEKEEE